VVKSVENLADTATIVLPGTHINRALHIEDKVKAGDPVEIQLGYDDNLVTEFQGYLNSIATDDATIKLECIDALYLFRKPVADKEYANITLKALLNEVVRQVGGHINVNCDYEFLWEKFTTYKAEGLDVLKKVQDETKANIYFRENTLHIHPPYSEIVNEKPVIYDFSRNIEKSNLKYMKAADQKVEVEIIAHKPDGKEVKKIIGNKGGRKISKTVGTLDEASMQLAAESEYNLWVYDGFEGDFTGWLVPFVEPAYKVKLIDREYTEKNGVYYVIATETKFSSSGGERKITLGRKLG
jgi:hypothetical protein